MSRLDDLDPDRLSAAQQALIAAIEGGPRAARHANIGLVGPFGVWLRAPELGQAAQQLGAAVRFGTALPDNVQEVAICTVGAFYRARFEFAAHASLAASAGVEPEVIEALRTGAAPPFERADERCAHAVTQALLHEHRIDDALYAEARELFGEQQLVELVTTIGYYCNISLTLNAFDVPLTEQMSDPFPQ